MGWLSANWLWIVLIGAMLLMHLRHGGMHGGHRGHDHSARAKSERHEHVAPVSTEAESTARGQSHRGC